MFTEGVNLNIIFYLVSNTICLKKYLLEMLNITTLYDFNLTYVLLVSYKDIIAILIKYFLFGFKYPI